MTKLWNYIINEINWGHLRKSTWRAIKVVIHVVIIGLLGFFTSQYLYLQAHQQKEPWKDSLMTAGEVVREQGQVMVIRIEPKREGKR